MTVASTLKLALALSSEVDSDTLPTDPRTQLAYYLIAFFGNSEDAFHQYADGLLTEEYWEARAAITIFQAEGKAGHQYWTSNKQFFTPSFVGWLDSGLTRE